MHIHHIYDTAVSSENQAFLIQIYKLFSMAVRGILVFLHQLVKRWLGYVEFCRQGGVGHEEKL